MENEKLNDHDLLITLHGEVKAMRVDINNLKLDVIDRIKTLECDVSSLKVWRGWLLGGLGVLTFLIGLITVYKK